ncbi:hypothetical protein Aduo_003021 [Ancylostoma duodenale]
MDERPKRRRVDSSYDQMDNRRLQQDLRDLRYVLHSCPNGRSEKHPTFCGEYGRHYSDSCLELVNRDDRWNFVRESESSLS